LKTSYPGLFVVHGADDYLRLSAVRRILERESDPSTRLLDLERVDGRDLDERRIAEIVQTVSLFSFDGSGSRMLRVDEADQIRAEPLKYLLAAIDGVSPGGTLPFRVLLVYGLEKVPPKSVTDRAAEITRCERLDWKSARPWLIDYARSRHGRVLAATAAEALIAALGMSDAGALAHEMDKLNDLAGDGGDVTPDLVAEATGVRVGRSVYDLCDAVGRRDSARASSILADVLGRPDYDGVRVVITIGYHIADLQRIRARLDRGESPKKATEIFARYWPKKRDELAAQARRWTLVDLDRASDLLLDVDLALKSGAKEQTFQVLSTYLHRIG
jgi:DNA polymerase III subunit delta